MPKYDEHNGNVIDDNGQIVINCARPPSDAMMKLYVDRHYCEFLSEEYEKISKKIELQEVKDQLFIVSTPSYCYAYLLFKLRKLSGLNQEEMASKICMSKSTLAKIENRFASPSLDTLHLVMYCFGINPIEFAELYWYVQGLVESNGRFYIPAKMTNFNSDNEIFIDSDREYERCTPINLYDKKVLKSVLEKLEMKFHETILIGKKRLMEIEENEKRLETEIEEDENLSFEERQHRNDLAHYEHSVKRHEFEERIRNQYKD